MSLKTIRALVLALSFIALGATQSPGQVIYDSTVTPLPGNLPSVGGEAYAFGEVGDAVSFAGTARNLKDVTVTLSSWGCQSGNWYTATCVTAPGATFNVDITFNIYSAGSPTPGTLIATRTQTFAVPYRPSSDNINCTGGRWKDASSGTCFNGLASNITFDFSSLNVVLPNSVVYGVSYNTTHYGPAPVGEAAACYTSSGGCPYDSMNVSLAPTVVVGSKPFPDTLYWDTIYAGFYCDGGSGGTGTFRLDSSTSACWGGFIPAAKFNAYTIATTAAGCKNNGWQSLSRAGGSPFKNQGDCIQYVNTNK